MSVNAPFMPCGNTVTFLASNPAPSAIQAPSNTLGGNQYRIINAGNVTVFMGYGANATYATSGANTPNGTIPNVLPLLPGTDEIITFIPNAWFTGNVATGNATIYITPGDGD
jgi:hypothetical protein